MSIFPFNGLGWTGLGRAGLGRAWTGWVGPGWVGLDRAGLGWIELGWVRVRVRLGRAGLNLAGNKVYNANSINTFPQTGQSLHVSCLLV